MRNLRLASAALAMAISIPSIAQTAKKIDAATGSVTGIVSCADTNAPARFAVVTLERVPEGTAESPEKEHEMPPMNATATTDLDGRFVLEKVPVGRYFVIGLLSGYMGPLSRFDREELRQPSADALKQMLQTVPTVSVEMNQVAQVNLRLDHATELSGTVLYDDGSPAIHLPVHLFHKDKNGEITPVDGLLLSSSALFGSENNTDDRGRYSIIGVPPGEFVVSVSMQTTKMEVGGLIGRGLSFGRSGGGGQLHIYTGNKFRLKQAKLIKAGEGEQLGGIDITIPLATLHTVKGTVTAKRDGHALSGGTVSLVTADDQTQTQFAEIDQEGHFELPYVAEDRYTLRALGGQDVELIQRHQFNSNYTEAKVLKTYAEAEIPLTVQGDVSSIEIAVPDTPTPKAATY
jgi:hypothetical protein